LDKVRFSGGTEDVVRLAGWLVAGWPATSQNHCSRPARTVFSSHNNQPEQYFSVLPNRPEVFAFARFVESGLDDDNDETE